MSLRSEILEQPAVLARLLETQSGQVHETARAIRSRGIRSIFIAARGSSKNAAVYAQYLWGSMNRLPVALAAPSLFTRYLAPPRLDEALVVGISQSGQSPDLVSVLAQGRAQGALTLAITNHPESPLAAQAELVLDTAVGPELALAATKTYTSQLLAIALLSAAMNGDREQERELARAPGLVAETLALSPGLEQAVERYRSMTQCVVLGRGFSYATARDWSLKLEELTGVVAVAYSAAEFRHGPIAIMSRGFPVLAVAPRGAVLEDVVALLSSLVALHQVDLVVISNEERALALAQTPLALPTDLPEWLSPVVSIVPAQLFSYHLTRARGGDTDASTRLHKVTETW